MYCRAFLNCLCTLIRQDDQVHLPVITFQYYHEADFPPLVPFGYLVFSFHLAVGGFLAIRVYIHHRLRRPASKRDSRSVITLDATLGCCHSLFILDVDVVLASFDPLTSALLACRFWFILLMQLGVFTQFVDFFLLIFNLLLLMTF